MKTFIILLLVLSLSLSAVCVAFPDDIKGFSDDIKGFFEEHFSKDSSEDSSSDSGDTTDPNALSYWDGTLLQGFVQTENFTTVVFYTDQLKPQTEYKISWRFNEECLNATDWYIPISSVEDHEFYNHPYFMYDTSYEAGVDGREGLYASSISQACWSHFTATSEQEGDQFMFMTFRIDTLDMDTVYEQYDLLMEYVMFVKIEEIV